MECWNHQWFRDGDDAGEIKEIVSGGVRRHNPQIRSPLCCSCLVYYNINSIASGEGGWRAVLVMAAAAVSPKMLRILKSDGRTRRMMLADI
jgi:hypothetical protein